MAGTLIITAANSSLAIPAVQHLLTKYNDLTAVLTVRNASENDVNTTKLRSTLTQFPHAKASIHQLDLANLSAVHDFAHSITADISAGKLPPLAAIVCNAYYWNLTGEAQITDDGYETSIQVAHIAHVALVLRLLGSFRPAGGRIVVFSSDAHWPGKNGLEKYPPALPEDLNLLVKPDVAHEKRSEHFGRGFQRYANSKLAIVTWMYALNRFLENDPNLSKITAVAINPGNLSDSRALRTNTPTMLYYMSIFIIRPFRLLLRLMDPTMRTSAEAGADVIDLAVNNSHPGERGYFTLLKKDNSSTESQGEEAQRKIWGKSAEWAGVTSKDTALKTIVFE
ncbi:hypothetical protein MMC22_002369 [Lobaria immixta]|nr:hypothetical protein [Lobaria immixta]